MASGPRSPRCCAILFGLGLLTCPGPTITAARAEGLALVHAYEDGRDLATFMHATALAASPDGLHVYVSDGSSTMLILVREPESGRLVNTATHFDGYYWSGLAVSPDGAHVYACGFDDIVVYGRDPSTGVLTELVEYEGWGVAEGFSSLAISPDGAQVYTTSFAANVLRAFARDPVTGELSQIDVETDGVGGVEGLVGANEVALSPGGEHLYVASRSGAVSVFARDPSTGELTFLEVELDGVGGVDGIEGAYSIAVSPDGAHVYVAGGEEDAIAVFARDPGTGTLTFVEVQRDGVGAVPPDVISGPSSVVVSADGAHVYVVGYGYVVPYGPALVAFARDGTSGGLTFLEAQRASERGLPASPNYKALAVGPHVYSSTVSDFLLLFQHVEVACPSTPREDCSGPAVGAKSLLKLVDSSDDRSDRALWRWPSASAVTLSEFGSDPAATTDYAFCVYDTSGAGQPRLRAVAPAGNRCGARSCWSTSATDYRYRDPERAPDGITRLELRSGAAGDARIKTLLGGGDVGMPTLPLTPPIRAQLLNSEGACWEAVYNAPDLNDASRFKATR